MQSQSKDSRFASQASPILSFGWVSVSSVQFQFPSWPWYCPQNTAQITQCRIWIWKYLPSESFMLNRVLIFLKFGPTPGTQNDSLISSCKFFRCFRFSYLCALGFMLLPQHLWRTHSTPSFQRGNILSMLCQWDYWPQPPDHSDWFRETHVTHERPVRDPS